MVVEVRRRRVDLLARQRLAGGVEYAAGSTGPEHVVAKFAALRDGALASARTGGTHERELRTYDELLAETDVAVPTVHASYFDPDTAHFLMVQDFVEIDGEVDQISGIGVDRARVVIGNVARVHARWWGSERLAAFPWLPRLDGRNRITNLTAMARAGWEPLCEITDLDVDARRLGDGLDQRVERVLRELATMPSTLLHCDLRTDNLLFEPDGTGVSIVDWQGAGIGPPAFDLAYFLSQCLTIDDRRRHEDDLLGAYRDDLAAAGVERTDDEVRTGYGAAMLYGLVIACAIPLVSDRHEPRARRLAATMADRAIAGLRDHGHVSTMEPS
ncbi:aminoglycoside phosphotransferase family protein [Ilumatobacter sp.]|uniref:aminoglycoside phosphotransferase family protein n=1 Tax=Ilumatobacter sp. TaxID=1967498 RepID=UPI003B51B569